MNTFKINITGAVQGVGFRPFVYQLAKELRLTGLVQNTNRGVYIEAEGPAPELELFLFRLQQEKPSLASIYTFEYSAHAATGYEEFAILQSDYHGHKTAVILPDISLCPDCLKELFSKSDRRFRYPFINCTHCGPRFSIVSAVPYDRENTSMKIFKMCPDCQKEYDDPESRRFHAQPNACPVCGPQIELWDKKGNIITSQDQAIIATAQAICEGKIVAFKGVGGFQLMVDASNQESIARLREKKLRLEKPFALMYPSPNEIKQDCVVSLMEERILLSPASPIIILERKKQCKNLLAENIAPGNPNLGTMLPYSALHHLLLRELNFPIVATSGNLNNEPICIDEFDALDRLKNIADVFLVHNRPIIRHADDSIVRVMAGRETVLRRARGYAPLPLQVVEPVPEMISVGAHLKNTIAISKGNEIFSSQHIGDLETAPAYAAFIQAITDFGDLYQVGTSEIICDLHPDYLSTKYAHQLVDSPRSIQHHYAHVMSCMADNELTGNCLGISWDGTGYGADKTIWGSEFLLINEKSYERVAHFHPFRLPGGELSIKEPRRTGLGLLYELFGKDIFSRKNIPTVAAFANKELELLVRMLERGLNSPNTCSMGRLFDAVASITGLRQYCSFEGQAAMELEFSVDRETKESYSFDVLTHHTLVIQWQKMVLEMLDDLRNHTSLNVIAAKFHRTLTEIIVFVAMKIQQPRILLTGGCFQNKFLLETTIKRLQEEQFEVFWHQRIPPNDGGIAIGQIFAAARSIPAFIPSAEVKEVQTV